MVWRVASGLKTFRFLIRIAPKQLPIPTLCHELRVAYEPADTGSQRIGRTIPLIGDTIGAEQSYADITMRRPFAQRVVDAQQQEPARHTRLGGIERGPQAAVRQKVEEAIERTEWPPRRGNSLDVEQGAQRWRHGKAALDNIETDPAQTVGEKQRFTSLRTLPDGQKIRPCGRIDAITIALARRQQRQTQYFGIMIGMPKDPRVRGRDVGMLSENAAPIGQDRRPRACWRVPRRARQYSRCRAAAIPT